MSINKKGDVSITFFRVVHGLVNQLPPLCFKEKQRNYPSNLDLAKTTSAIDTSFATPITKHSFRIFEGT